MVFDFTGVNWIAVVVAAVAGVVLGYIWYLPQVFGSRWAAATGRDLPSITQLSPMTLVIGVVLDLVVAYVLALLITGLGATTVDQGALVGLVAGIGLYAVPIYSAVLYEGRSTAWWAITAGYGVVTSVVMGAIIGYLGPA